VLSETESWQKVAREICETLRDGLDVLGVVEAADVFVRAGATCLEVVVEASDLVGDDQHDAYRVLCDLLETRLGGDSDQVVGFLIFEGDPSPAALVTGLGYMDRPDGSFVPVLPLEQRQARNMADASARFVDLVDDAMALVQRPPGPHPYVVDDARSTLFELHELIKRECLRSAE
jgi:hypothetical protein